MLVEGKSWSELGETTDWLEVGGWEGEEAEEAARRLWASRADEEAEEKAGSRPSRSSSSSMSSSDRPDVVLPALLIPTPPSLVALRAFFFVFLPRCASLVCPSESSMLSTSSNLVNLSRSFGTNAADLAGADADAPVEFVRRWPGCIEVRLAVKGMARGLGKAGTTVGSVSAAIAALLALRFLFPRPMPESSSSSSTTGGGTTTGGGSPRT